MASSNTKPALWGRRLVGEALSQAQRVAVERAALTGLLTGTVDRPGMDLAAMSQMFSKLIAIHSSKPSVGTEVRITRRRAAGPRRLARGRGLGAGARDHGGAPVRLRPAGSSLRRAGGHVRDE